MDKSQTTFDCVRFFYDACPHKDDPLILKFKCLASPTSKNKTVMSKDDNKQIELLCKGCPDYVKYL